MCRLRVGHMWLTQSYLLKNEEQPFCYACDSLYTVRHILIECPDFQDTRRKYFSVTDLYIFERRSCTCGGLGLRVVIIVEHQDRVGFDHQGSPGQTREQTVARAAHLPQDVTLGGYTV
ncbi:Pol-like protein [Plakobranchus ocellatus]|uniref:Pol-like protein n=1 Tax=Plakobranchus ocellatus TaxID=259542 RepID=A0AAV4BQB2_9GAST|nr:Pol-like protein [Plakobranchus ocellatus]